MEMNEQVKVTIDFAPGRRRPPHRLGAASWGGTARSFMQYAGFSPDQDGTWIGPRTGLLRLNHSEVLAVEPAGA